ncbi:peptidoglycan recognition protein family protein [Planomicrobium okeanokoites]|uniref:N-acetylmuramoyl-L-alanine amidase n=1 Tax=Planomicrobium okeanokoites TaxID=244 RepID=A0ABV7KTI1_PLAOK|nr:XlyB [Planomicrobium okeanokoites]
MAYTIVNKFIPTSLYALKAPYAMDAQYITIHNTANDATAINEIAYMHRNPAATSYHVAVDDIHAVQAIPFSRNAWHAGDGASGQGNRKSIGIEICYSKSGGEKYKKAEANAIEYIAHVLHQYNWGIERVMWHRNWSGKNCPHRIFAEGRADEVKKRIADRLAELKKPSTEKPPVVVKPATPEKEVTPVSEPKNAPSSWAKRDVEAAVKLGISDGSRLQEPVTREEAIVLAMRAAGLAPRIK